MGAAIPKVVKDKVLTLYISGHTRKKIAKSLKISTGSVSNILAEFRNEIPQLSLAREIGKVCRAENLSIQDLSISMHLKKLIDSISGTEEQIEDLIEYAQEYCFDRGTNIVEFIKSIFEVCDLSEELVVPPGQLQSYLKKLKHEAVQYEQRISELKAKIENLHRKYDVTHRQLQRYNSERPLLKQIFELKTQVQNVQEDKIRRERKLLLKLEGCKEKMQINAAEYEWKMNDWHTPEEVVEEIKIRNRPLDPMELFSAAKNLLNSPEHYKDIIPVIVLRYRNLHKSKVKTEE